MADEFGSGLKATKDPYSYEPSPELQAINTGVQEKFAEQAQPLAKAVTIIANPQATGEDKLFAADQLKSVANRSEFRLADFVQSVLNLNVRDAIIAATGGTHTRVQAWDQNGNEYYKIFNQRITKQNPYGELVGYEDTKFRPLSGEDVKGKVIVGQNEVPLTQRPFYSANMITAKEAATIQASNWNNLQQKQAAISLAVPEFKDLVRDNSRVLDYLKTKSVDPDTRALLAGAAEIRTGNKQLFQSSLNDLKSAKNSSEFNQAKENFKKVSGGITIGVNWTEGKGKTDNEGNKIGNDQIEEIGKAAMSNMSSENSVLARKDDLLNRAQALKFKGDIEGFDAMQRYINNEYKKSLLINSMLKHGDIGIATPNIEYKTGDSFSLAAVKNQTDAAFADLAEHFATTVNQKRGQYANNPPPVGLVEADIATNPYVKQRKNELYMQIDEFEKQNKPVAQQTNVQKPSSELLMQPSVGMTNIGSETSAKQPPAGREVIVKTAPQGSRPPAKPAEKQPRSLSKIFD